MAPNDEGGRATRRRGAALEAAILDAGWEQLLASGYGGFTFEAVADRAGTSKPVLYRRWSTREEMLLAVVGHRGADAALPVPDTGSLRGDVLALLSTANRERTGMWAFFSAQLGAYYQDGTLTPADFRRAFIGERPSSMSLIMQRALERGEVNPERLSPRAVSLPFDLFRQEAMMTLRPVPDDVIREIVDDVFLPLVGARAHG